MLVRTCSIDDTNFWKFYGVELHELKDTFADIIRISIVCVELEPCRYLTLNFADCYFFSCYDQASNIADR